MPMLTIALADLPAELSAIPRQDQEAIQRAIRRTLELDAPRWIQWSIKGGGYGGPTGWQRTTPRKAPRKPKRTGVRKLIAKIRGFSKHRRTSTPPAPIKVKDPCARRVPPAYREPVDTGDYKNSWKSSFTKEGGMFYSSSNPPMKAGVIEYGRRQAFIPTPPLADWVRRKLGCKDPKKSLSIAIAISIHASRNKRPGLFVLERAHPKIAEAYGKNLERELHGPHKQQPKHGRSSLDKFMSKANSAISKMVRIIG